MIHPVRVAHHFVLACLTLLAAGRLSEPCFAASVEGTIVFPSKYVPAMQVYAREIDTSRIVSQQTHQDQTNFRFELPVGRYVFFAIPDEPGAPEIYGAYSAYSECQSRPQNTACDDHTLAVLTLAPKTQINALKIDDWYLPDEVADELDRILGITASPSSDELGAPHFSEYPIARLADTTAPKLDIAATEITPEQRVLVNQALLAGPNFAGAVSAIAVPCGSACTQMLLLDWRSGKLAAKGVLPPLQGQLPCRSDEALRFRRDSRLLSITRKRDTVIVTQYFVWKPETATLAQTAEYQRAPERFCATGAR